MKNYIVKAPIMIHRGKQYRQGEPIPLDDAIAAAQIKAGNVVSVPTSTPEKEAK